MHGSVALSPIGNDKGICALGQTEWLLMIVAIGILAACVIPPLGKAISTRKAMHRVQSIHQALVHWKADSDLGNGSLPENTHATARVGKTFAELFPAAALWWANGDDSYEYRVSTEASATPKVIAIAREKAKAYPQRIASLPDGTTDIGRPPSLLWAAMRGFILFIVVLGAICLLIFLVVRLGEKLGY